MKTFNCMKCFLAVKQLLTLVFLISQLLTSRFNCFPLTGSSYSFLITLKRPWAGEQQEEKELSVLVSGP